MNAPLVATLNKQDLTSWRDVNALLRGEKAGHLGGYGYLEGGAETVEQFFNTHKGYYPRHAEVASLRDNGELIALKVKDTRRLIVIGPGPAESLAGKEWQIIPHLNGLEEVVLVDVSQKFCDEGGLYLTNHFKEAGRNVSVTTLVCDYAEVATQIQKVNNTTVVCTGGLISNMPRIRGEDYPETQMQQFLQAMGHIAGRGQSGKIVLGYDSNDDPEKILGSYDHPLFRDYIWACFSNALQRSGFTHKCPNIRDHFRHVTEWRSPTAEHKLIVEKPIEFCDQSDHIALPQGRELVILNSVKPSPSLVQKLGENVGIQTDTSIRSGGAIIAHILCLLPSCSA